VGVNGASNGASSVNGASMNGTRRTVEVAR